MSALKGLIVVEMASRPCGEYCGKLLSDFGAEVIKIEPPGGSPTRAMGPFKDGVAGPERSALFAYLNTNKKSVALDLSDAADRAKLDRLLARANALIEDHPDTYLKRCGAEGSFPHLVQCVITPFGQGAPDDWQIARPLNVISAGGWAFHTPSETPADKPPLKGAGRFLPDYESGIDAALCVAASLLRQRRTGKGQLIDISEVEVQINRVDCVLGRMLAGEQEPSNARTAYDMGGPAASFACADGFLYVFMTTKVHWQALCSLMEHPAWTADFPEDWLEFHCTPDRVAQFRQHFAGWALGQHKHTVSEQGQKLGVTIVPVNSAADLPDNPQLLHRGFFQKLDHPVLGEALYPTVSYKLSATPVVLNSPAPALGQHGREFIGDATSSPLPLAGGVRGGPVVAGTAPQTNTPTPSPSRKREGDLVRRPNRGGPLSGIRVLELTKVWAGPYAGKYLAHLGAEVIKVESLTNLDEMRAYGGVDIDAAPYFQSINQEILSVQVNMKTPEGLELVRKMVAQSDIVLDNIRPGAMARSGLDYAALKAIKPDIIAVSIKMWGTDGPFGYQTGYAPCFAALSGLSFLVGHEGEVPRGMNIRYGDSTAGACAALAAVAALHHRKATGEGQFIDLSAVETMTSLIGDSLFSWSVTGDLPQADGNYHAEMCPHGVYPCADGDWLSIAVGCDQEWQALCDALGLDAAPAHATLAGRQADRHAIDAAIAARTASEAASALGERLRAAGVPAFRAASSINLCSDDHLWGRGAYRMVSDHRNGSRPIIAPPWRMTPDEATIERGAPLLGEHNDYVYGELLGLPPGDIADLKLRKVID